MKTREKRMGKLLFIIGLVLAPIPVVASGWYAVHALFGGEPLEAGAYVGIAIYGGLPLVIMFIGLATWRDLRKALDRSKLARLGVVLLTSCWIVAAAAGCVIGNWLAGKRIQEGAERDRSNCQRLFGHTEPPRGCVELARLCRKGPLDLREVDFPGGMPPPGLWPSRVSVPGLLETRAVVLCIHRRQAELQAQAQPGASPLGP
jgi:hypothetical protein